MEHIDTFLHRQSQKPKIIVIYGPTWAGKTSMSIEIAQYLQTEIISTDSRQIYKWMDIGTWKITSEEAQGVPHHMLDIIHPDQEFSVGDFKHQSWEIIRNLHLKNKIPMLVGGTGLYINSLIFDYGLPQVPADKKLRDEMNNLSLPELYQKLQSIDPDYAKEIHPNNRPYIERAIEVKILTWKSKAEFREEKKLKYDVLFLTPYKDDREELYDRINARVEMMFEMWLEREVKSLVDAWYHKDTPGMNSIWYAEFFPYFAWEILISEVIAQIQQNSRNYAKRQLTWFRDYQKYTA